MTGCKTIPHPASQSDYYFKGTTLNRQNAAMAEALANYGTGILREGQHDAGAITNYLRAIQLEPRLSSIYLRAAVQHIRCGDKNKAVSIMEEACRSNPKSLEAVLLLSQIYQIANQPDDARKAAQRAIDIEPRNYKGYVQLASLYIADQDEQNAIKVLKKALQKADEQLHVLRMLGDLHVQRIQSISKSSCELKEAIRYYEKAVALPTDDLSLVYLQRLGDLYLINRQADKALVCFQKIAVHDPDNIQAQQKKALCYIALGNRKKALEALRNIAGRKSESANLYYYLGELYDTLGDQEHAIESYKAARDVDPLNPKSYLKMAVIHLRDNPQKAKEILQDGLKRMPKERLFLEILGQIYLRNRQYSEALTLFEQMQSSLKPDDPIFKDPRFYIHYGIAAQQCRQIDKAIMLYLKAIELAPDSLEARMRQASLEILLGNSEEALALMEDAVMMNPGDAATWFFYAIINIQSGQYKQAVAAFKETEKLAKLLSDRGVAALDAAFYFNYGAACERSGDYENAEILLSQAIMLAPENSETFNYLAYMWAEQGIKLDQALEYVSHALDLEPDNGAYLDTLGWIFFKQKKYAAALENVQNARALMPDDPTILDHLGDILFKLGRKQEAVDAWKASFQIDSTNTALEKKLRTQGIDVDKLRNSRKPDMNRPAIFDE